MRHLLAIILWLLATQVCADSWGPARVSGVASPSGQFVVRVVPGTNLGAVYGFSGSHEGKMATATYYRLDSVAKYVKFREVSLLNPIAPVFTAVADSGEFVTLDNWHNVGVGAAVVVVYTSDGSVLRSYRLDDMYSEAEIQKFEHSVSSIKWRCPSQPAFKRRTSVLEFVDAFGTNVEVNLKTGIVKRNLASRKSC